MFRAGDVVAHAPTGEEWVLACDEHRGNVMPYGWPETIALASDCTLIESATDGKRLEVLIEVSKSEGLRASRAREQLEAAKGGATC